MHGFQLHSPGGERILFGDWDAVKSKGSEVRVGVALSKESLLKGMLDDCESFNVDIFSGTNVTGIKKQGDTVQVETAGETFEAPFVIAADGINSRIARVLGFNKERTYSGTLRDVTWVMEGEIPLDPGSFNFILAEEATFYVVPCYREGLYHVGTFNFKTGMDLGSLIETFTKEHKTYAPWFHKAKKVGIHNCISNELAPIKDPFKDNVLLVGDAAWVREFSNPAAITAGWKAGEAVTLALIEKKYNREGVSAYLEWWDKNVFVPHGKMEQLPAPDLLQASLSGEEIDYLVSLVEKPFPATMSFFKLFSQLGGIFSELFPTIEQARPELMTKMYDMRTKMGPALEEQRKAGFANK
jgi:flavin-dependent dehydrogenase